MLESNLTLSPMTVLIVGAIHELPLQFIKLNHNHSVPLDNVAKILIKNPDYRLAVSVRIDNAEDKVKAEFLCQNRADSIAAYLEGKGVLDRQLLVRMFDTNRRKADSKPLESTSKMMVELKLLGY